MARVNATIDIDISIDRHLSYREVQKLNKPSSVYNNCCPANSLLPIQGRLRQRSSHGSMNLFFTSEDFPNSIFGITCDHVISKIDTNVKIHFRPAGSRLPSVIGYRYQLKLKDYYTDLGIVKFSINQLIEQSQLEEIELDFSPRHNLKGRIIDLYGLQTSKIRSTCISLNQQLTHDEKRYKQLICFEKIGGVGDSGNSLFTHINGKILCFGQLYLIKDNKSYVTNLENNLTQLKKEIRIDNFYYLTNNRYV